jgi:flagellar protein FlaG
MAESVITVSIITIACVICATMLVSAIYPAVNRATSSVVSSSAKLGDRIETSVDIIAEANESSYEYVWVKNIGSQIVRSQIENSDIFFGEIGNFQRIPFNATLLATPSWNYSIENDDGNDRWDAGETINITISSASEITAGDYYVKIVLYNGVSDEEKFSI